LTFLLHAFVQKFCKLLTPASIVPKSWHGICNKNHAKIIGMMFAYDRESPGKRLAIGWHDICRGFRVRSSGKSITSVCVRGFLRIVFALDTRK